MTTPDDNYSDHAELARLLALAGQPEHADFRAAVNAALGRLHQPSVAEQFAAVRSVAVEMGIEIARDSGGAA